MPEWLKQVGRTAQPVEIVWILLSFVAYVDIRLALACIEDNRADGQPPAERVQGLVNVVLFACLATAKILFGLVALPNLFLEPRFDVDPDPRFAALLASTLSPVVIIVAYLVLNLATLFMWWGRREIKRLIDLEREATRAMDDVGS